MFHIKEKGFSAAVAVALGVQLLAAPLFPAHTEAAIPAIDEKNIAHVIEQVKKLEAMLGAENKQVLMMIINQRKIDPKAILEIETRNKKNKTWAEQTVLDHVLYNKSLNYHDLLRDVHTGDKSLDVVITAWNQRLGDLEGIINGTVSPRTVLKNEANRRKAVAQGIKSNAQRDVATALKDEQIKKQVDELAKKAMNSNSQLEVSQITAAIMAASIQINGSTNESLSRIFQGEAQDRYKKYVDDEVKSQIIKESQEMAKAVAKSNEDKK